MGGRKGTEREGGQGYTHIEPAKGERKMAGLFDDLANLGLRVDIIARVEQDTPATRCRRLRQDLNVEMVERLDDARAENELAEHLARMLAAEIDRLDAIGGERIVRVLGVGRVRLAELDPLVPAH